MSLKMARSRINWQRLANAEKLLRDVMDDCDVAADCNVPVEDRRRTIAAMNDAISRYRDKLFPDGEPLE